MQFGICSYESRKLDEIPNFNYLNILPKNRISLEDDLTSYLPKKITRVRSAKIIPLEKNAFSIETKFTFFT